MRTSRIPTLVTTLAASVFAASAFAEGDIWLSVQGSKLTVGGIEEFPATTTTAGVRVFDAEMGADVDNATDEPGLRVLTSAEGGPSMTPGTQIGFIVNRALRQWNGSDFSTLAPFNMNLSFASFSASTPLTDTPAPGFNVPVEANGGLHDHYDFILNSGSRQAGIWLLDLTFTTNQSGISNSDNVWIVFSQDADAASLESALDYANTNIPTPGPLVAGLVSLGLVARRRR